MHSHTTVVAREWIDKCTPTENYRVPIYNHILKPGKNKLIFCHVILYGSMKGMG